MKEESELGRISINFTFCAFLYDIANMQDGITINQLLDL